MLICFTWFALFVYWFAPCEKTFTVPWWAVVILIFITLFAIDFDTTARNWDSGK